MLADPDTQYARRGDAHIAYQLSGEGELDVVSVSGWFSHLEARWELPGFAHYLDRLACFSRVVSFDKSGIGLSDPIPASSVPPLEEWIEDVRAVMDAAGVERAAIVGASEGALMAVLFAAMHPERTSALVLINGTARLAAADDYPIGLPPESCAQMSELFASTWGRPDGMATLNPSVADDPAALAAWTHFLRLAASPGTAAAVIRTLFELDVRALLPSVRVPTLVVHRSDVLVPPLAQGRYVAEQIEGARFVEVPGSDYSVVVGDGDVLLDPVEEFLIGARGAGSAKRALATLVFADVVSSTVHLAELGDRRWRQLLELQEGVVARQLSRHGGRLVNTAGDGIFATFDGPARAVAFALALREAVRAIGLKLRVGIHVGEVERTQDDQVAGLAVHIASRISTAADPGQILVSRTVRDLSVGAPIQFADQGSHTLRGVPEPWQLYSVEG
jgi:class 3 adenylate cyclase